MRTAHRTSPRSRALGWTAAALLVASVTGLWLYGRAGDGRPRFRADAAPRAQRTALRSWQPWRWERLAHVGAAEGLQRPAYLSIGRDERLALFDGDDFAVKEIDSRGRIVASLALPDAALAITSIPITDLSVDAEGTVWFCNPGTATVALRRQDGAARRTAGAYKLVATRDRLFAMNGPGTPQLFSVADGDGRAVASFGALLEQQVRHGIVLDGDIAADRATNVVFYAPYYGGFATSYGAGGERRFHVATIDAPPLPRLTRLAGGIVKAAPPTPGAVRLSDLAAHGDTLYLLVQVPGEGGRRSVVDMYAAADGVYRGSLELPARCDEIAVAPGRVYTRCGDAVSVWRTGPPASAAVVLGSSDAKAGHRP